MTTASRLPLWLYVVVSVVLLSVWFTVSYRHVYGKWWWKKNES